MEVRRQRVNGLADHSGRGSCGGGGADGRGACDGIGDAVGRAGAGGDDGGPPVTALHATRGVLVVEVRAHAARPLARGRHVLTVVMTVGRIRDGTRALLLLMMVVTHRTGGDIGRSPLRTRVAQTVDVLAQQRLRAPAHGAFQRRRPVGIRAVLAGPLRLRLFKPAVHLRRLLLSEGKALSLCSFSLALSAARDTLLVDNAAAERG